MLSYHCRILGGPDLVIFISHHCSADISAPLMFKQRPQTFYAAISCLNNPRSHKLYFIFVRLKLTQSSFRSLHLAEEAEVSVS